MSLSDINSLQGTIKDLQAIVNRNQGSEHEAAHLVKQIQDLVSEIERKAKLTKRNEQQVAVPPNIQPVQVSF